MKKSGPKPKLFMEWVSPEPNSGCWLWTGFTSRKGYGQVTYNGRMQLAHRVSYMLHVGPISEALQICHKCDVPSCVNPDHLFPGTALDNERDKIAKGRRYSTAGEASGTAKLTAEQVREIRAKKAAGQTGRSIAAEYGITPANVSAILCGKIWGHVIQSQPECRW